MLVKYLRKTSKIVYNNSALWYNGSTGSSLEKIMKLKTQNLLVELGTSVALVSMITFGFFFCTNV